MFYLGTSFCSKFDPNTFCITITIIMFNKTKPQKLLIKHSIHSKKVHNFFHKKAHKYNNSLSSHHFVRLIVASFLHVGHSSVSPSLHPAPDLPLGQHQGQTSVGACLLCLLSDFYLTLQQPLFCLTLLWPLFNLTITAAAAAAAVCVCVSV